MNRRLLGAMVWMWVLLGAVLPARVDAQADAADKARIESLIRHVETLADASFIRNGRSYQAKDAAKFLRGKWNAKAADLRSAGDFIREVASKSGTTGKPYKIRFKDGREVDCGTYLAERLAEIDEKK